MPLPSPIVDSLSSRIDLACKNPEHDLPGVAVAVIGKDGKELFSHAAGQRGVGGSESMSPDSVFWIASCTKMIVGIACMQLVEQGRLSLDDVAQVERLCPELKAVKVLQPDGQLVEKIRGITLRMLLTHTAGFGYSFINSSLRDHGRPTGFNEFSGHVADFKQPLVNQPGEVWEYGINIDWAGIILERLTGQSLGSYIEENIFKPLGLVEISMIPFKNMKEKLAYMHQRDSSGQLSVRDHLLRRALTVDKESEVDSLFMSGGAGCFSTPQDYTRILATLLNNGISPNTGKQILRKETVDEMFSNQIAHLHPLSETHMPSAKSDLIRPTTGLHPTVEGDRQGWGLTFLLSGGITGRSVGTAQWSGLPNLRWWCDRERGVAGIICTQVLPFGDTKLFHLSQDVEKLVYQGLST
ncbi:beta-lactamase/transpeptidase-like protein [Aspergillus cavernicola]|uniref:Beta-lactamase/transpeptidase-like protein n=1 Tax=Aspergillus cavernicola TaxID=176166 RepID=A0ABR4HGY0_9EURO